MLSFENTYTYSLVYSLTPLTIGWTVPLKPDPDRYRYLLYLLFINCKICTLRAIVVHAYIGTEQVVEIDKFE